MGPFLGTCGEKVRDGLRVQNRKVSYRVRGPMFPRAGGMLRLRFFGKERQSRPLEDQASQGHYVTHGDSSECRCVSFTLLSSPCSQVPAPSSGRCASPHCCLLRGSPWQGAPMPGGVLMLKTDDRRHSLIVCPLGASQAQRLPTGSS